VRWNADDLGTTLRYRTSEADARAPGVNVQPLDVREPNDFDQALAAINRDSGGAGRHRTFPEISPAKLVLSPERHVEALTRE
jgi:hypothetical protein